MESNERDRKLDQWLDEALSEYSAAEPRFGLEQRVLNRIRTEEQDSRKWNFWRWMPAFGAIAAVIVVAVAVGPMMVRRSAVRQMNSKIYTYSPSTEQVPKSKASESLAGTVAVPKTKPATHPELNDKARGTPPIKQELAIVPQKKIVPQGGDRDRLISSHAAQMDAQLQPSRTSDQNAPASASESAKLSVSAGTPAPEPPPPPPPVPQVQPEVAGGATGGVIGNVSPSMAKAPSATREENELKANTQTVEVRADASVPLDNKVATESLTSVIAKDARRKEAHAKPEAAPQDTNTIQAIGVTVRFQTGPMTPTQQFPTPVPLSNQEKLALKAARELKDSTVAQRKSADITPLEVKDVVIKPLEGTEKDKEREK
jgi:hypothetical protein